MKLSHSDLPKFSGDIADQEKYHLKFETLIGTLMYAYLLDRDAANEIEIAQDKELYNLLNLSFMNGKASSVITNSLMDEDGNFLPQSGCRAWEAFNNW